MDESMRTRLKDVANRVNLSPALVSGVLNGRANVWASEATRARVREAARELDYHPSAAAKSLSAGRTNAVALVYRRLDGPDYRLAYTGLVDAFSAELQSRGLDLMVSNFATQGEVLDHLRRLKNSHACDAVILWGRESDTEPQGELLDALGMPFLVKGRHEARHPAWRQVDFDHEGMTARALETLVGIGHRRIAYLGFPHEDRYVQALRGGFAAAHGRLLGGEPRHVAAAEDALAPNAAAIEAMLDAPDAPTGFVIGAGVYAWHALEGCLARRGGVLSREPGGYAAAGIASSHPFALTFGEATAFQGVEIDNLAVQGAPGLLDAILHDATGERIVRHLPELTPLPTVGLSVVPPASRHGPAP